eukprot:SAG25_NODE_3_length_30426_cov_8.268210_25_plen_276_part_00
MVTKHMQDAEVEQEPALKAALEALGELGGTAPETVDASWAAHDAQVGDLIAVQELDCEQWWLSRVIVRNESRSGGRSTRRFAEVGPDFTLRIIDPRLSSENLDLVEDEITDPRNDLKTEWATKQEHGGLPHWRPVFLGHSTSYIRAPAEDVAEDRAPPSAMACDGATDGARAHFIGYITGMFADDESRLSKDMCARVLSASYPHSKGDTDTWRGEQGRDKMEGFLRDLREDDAIYVDGDEIVLREREQQVLMEQADPQSVASHAPIHLYLNSRPL